jgi:hypothetical protein
LIEDRNFARQYEARRRASIGFHWTSRQCTGRIEYGNSVTEPLEIVRKLASETDDYRLLFNEANLAQLADQTSEAYDSWIKYLAKRWSGPEVEKLVQPLLARVAAERWSAVGYREAVRAITMQCQAASVSALSETPFEQNEGYSVELQLLMEQVTRRLADSLRVLAEDRSSMISRSQ